MRTFLIAVALLALTGIAFAAAQDNVVNYGVGGQGYDGTLSNGTWSGGTRDSLNGYATKLDLTADVEMWASETLATRTINFHWGRPDQLATQNGDVAATLSNNFNLWLSLEGDANSGCAIDEMIWNSGPSGSQSAAGAPIAVEWSCSLNNNGVFRACKVEGNSAYYSTDGTSRGVVAPGTYIYAWRAAATVTPTQAAGHYQMDPTVTLTPIVQ